MDAGVIVVADDHPLFRGALRQAVAAAAPEAEILEAGSFDEVTERLAAGLSVDLVLLDLNMPGMQGVAGLRRAIKLNTGKPVAIITGNPTPRMLDEIMNAGSSGIVLKTTGVRSLANAIRFMHAGEHYMPLELVRDRHNAGRTTKNGRLSDKEMMVLSYLAEGKQNKEIANDLKLAEPTIKMHVTSICKKLTATNRTQAVIVARDLGLI